MWVRNPASTCPTGTRWWQAASADAKAVVLTWDDDHVGLEIPHQPRHALERANGDLRERLTDRHDVEVVVGLDPEEVKHLVEHLPVLGSDGNAHAEQALDCSTRARA